MWNPCTIIINAGIEESERTYKIVWVERIEWSPILELPACCQRTWQIPPVLFEQHHCWWAKNRQAPVSSEHYALLPIERARLCALYILGRMISRRWFWRRRISTSPRQGTICPLIVDIWPYWSGTFSYFASINQRGGKNEYPMVKARGQTSCLASSYAFRKP